MERVLTFFDGGLAELRGKSGPKTNIAGGCVVIALSLVFLSQAITLEAAPIGE